jgi:hypothetical protein
MLGIQIVMKKKFPRNKINIKRETRKEKEKNSSRKVSTQKRIAPHQMRMMIVIVNRTM